MWQALLIKLVVAGLKELSKYSENKVDDQAVKYIEELVTLENIKAVF